MSLVPITCVSNMGLLTPVLSRCVAEDEDVVDLRAMSTVGGVMYLDLLKLPPQAKKVGSWVIQDSKFI